MAQLSGQGPTIVGAATSEVVDTSLSPNKAGLRARDVDGNEYLWVDYTGTVFARMPVLIKSDHTAALVGTSGRGRIGVVTTGATSDQSGWVQIYGRCVMQLMYPGVSGPSPSDDANGPTTDSTSLRTRFMLPTTATSGGLFWTSDASTDGFFVEGMTVASDASPSNDVSKTCDATSHSGAEVGVFLNYPHVMYRENVSQT